VEILLEAIALDVAAPSYEALPTELIVRRTTAPPPTA